MRRCLTRIRIGRAPFRRVPAPVYIHPLRTLNRSWAAMEPPSLFDLSRHVSGVQKKFIFSLSLNPNAIVSVYEKERVNAYMYNKESCDY